MSFGVNNRKVGLKSVTLADLTKGLDPKKDKKQIERIKIAFDYFNKPSADGKKDNELSYEEQIAMLNFMNQADGNFGERDGQITRKDLRQSRKQNGLENTPKYKEYKAFMEAYQNAVAGFEKDEVAEIGYFRRGDVELTETRFSDEQGSTKEEYTADTKNPELQSSIYKDNTTGARYYTDNKNRIIRQTVDGVTTKYMQFDGEAEDATPTVIQQNGATYSLQENGYYKTAEGAAARLNDKGTLEPIEIDNKNRLTKETFDNAEYTYTYSDDSTTPATITITASGEKGTSSTTFTSENGLYTAGNAGQKFYFTFNPQKHEFSPAQAPKPAIVKPQYARSGKVHQTEVWKNQRFGADKAQELGLNNLNTAQEVLDKIVMSSYVEFSEGRAIDRDKLLADFIKNNPSVFAQSGDSKGVLFSDAKWDRLDFPKDLKSYITEE